MKCVLIIYHDDIGSNEVVSFKVAKLMQHLFLRVSLLYLDSHSPHIYFFTLVEYVYEVLINLAENYHHSHTFVNIHSSIIGVIIIVIFV